jgi:hypothetical protein
LLLDILLVFVVLVPLVVLRRILMVPWHTRRARAREMSSEHVERTVTILRCSQNLDWLHAADLTFLGGCEVIHSTLIEAVAWRDGEQRVEVRYNLLGSHVYVDVLSEFGGGLYLCTSNHPGVVSPPGQPLSLAQVFPKTTGEELFQRHYEALALITGETGQAPQSVSQPLPERITGSLRDYSRAIRAYPWWPVALLRLTLIEARRRRNLTIADQLARGIIHLPPKAAA